MIAAMLRRPRLSIARYPGTRHSIQQFSSVYAKNAEELMPTRESVNLKGDHKIVFSTGGKLAHLAAGSAICAHGNSVVHAAVSTAPSDGATSSFLPLTVDYRSRAYAFGTIPKTSSRRERHGSDEETLVSRAIDRAMRPLFAKGYIGQVQLIITTHSADGVHDPVVASVNAASLALLRANLPWSGPVGCVRVGLIENKLVINPTINQMSSSNLDLIYAGSTDMPIMMECSAKQVPESVVRQAMFLAQEAVREITDAQKRLLQREGIKGSADTFNIVELLADEDISREIIQEDSPASRVGFIPTNNLLKVPDQMQLQLNEWGHKHAVKLFHTQPGLTRKQRGIRENALQSALFKQLNKSENTYNGEHTVVKAMAVDTTTKNAFREAYFASGIRVDGRKNDEVRTVRCTTDVLPTVHGSSFFQRGDTHVLSSVTLGPRGEAKTVLSLNGSMSQADAIQRFILHYDFPPYCTNVIGKTSPNRRMVGHGALAEKALRPVLPSEADFPYTIRVFAECTSSSGSSSMGSACAASLALLDAGVPLRSPVAGVSVGVIAKELVDGSHDWKQRMILTDLLGTEDYYGLMDFKVAGTADGITAFQMDMKSPGMPLEVLGDALDAARTGRLHILQCMAEARASHRESVKDNAPRAEIVHFDPERKRHLLGPGGEMVRHIEAEYGVTVDTSVDGQAYIFGTNAGGVEDARMLAQELVAEVAPGDVFAAEVLDIKDFGAMVKITRAQEAILHMSEITHDAQLATQPMETLLAVGQRLDVQVMSVDKALGAVRVSRKKLIDPNSPDRLVATPPSKNQRRMESLPTFAVVPPRRFSKDFFKDQVAETPQKPDEKLERKVVPKQNDTSSIKKAAVVLKQKVAKSDSNSNVNSDENTTNSYKVEETQMLKKPQTELSTPPHASIKSETTIVKLKGQMKSSALSDDKNDEEVIKALIDKRALAKSNQAWADVSRFTKRLRDEFGVVVRDGEDSKDLRGSGVQEKNKRSKDEKQQSAERSKDEKQLSAESSTSSSRMSAQTEVNASPSLSLKQAVILKNKEKSKSREDVRKQTHNQTQGHPSLQGDKHDFNQNKSLPNSARVKPDMKLAHAVVDAKVSSKQSAFESAEPRITSTVKANDSNSPGTPAFASSALDAFLGFVGWKVTPEPAVTSASVVTVPADVPHVITKPRDIARPLRTTSAVNTNSRRSPVASNAHPLDDSLDLKRRRQNSMQSNRISVKSSSADAQRQRNHAETKMTDDKVQPK